MGSAEDRARDQQFTILVSRAERRVDISILPGGIGRFCLPPRRRSLAGTAGGQREDFFQEKREQFGGENSERPVVFWRPSEEKVRGQSNPTAPKGGEVRGVLLVPTVVRHKDRPGPHVAKLQAADDLRWCSLC